MKNLKLFISSTLLLLTFTSFDVLHGMEDPPPIGVPNRPSMQLSKGADNTLEAVLGTGNNVLLKISVNLKSLQTTINKEQVEATARLFLTDFTSRSIGHQPVNIKVKVNCESTPIKVNLPSKPNVFKSYSHFESWLNQGYFTNEARITYDFHVDPVNSAPHLAQQLYALSPGGYHFFGTHVVYNDKMLPDKCLSKIAFSSQRGTINSTTITLSGALFLNKKPYPTDDHNQIFPHQVIEEKICKEDCTKKFYNHQWLAGSEITTMVTYKEFADDELKNWPKAPSEIYTIVQKKPGRLEDIQHLACWDGNSGKNVDIRNGKIFTIDCGALDGYSEKQRHIVKDMDGRLYTVQHLDLKVVKAQEEKRQKELAEAQRKKVLLEKTNSPAANLLRQEITAALKKADEAHNNILGWDVPSMKHFPQRNTAIDHWSNEQSINGQAAKVAMQKLYAPTGETHPRMNEMRGY